MGSKSVILVRFWKGFFPCDRSDLAHHAQWSIFFFEILKFYLPFFISLYNRKKYIKTKKASNIFLFKAFFTRFWPLLGRKFHLIKIIYNFCPILKGTAWWGWNLIENFSPRIALFCGNFFQLDSFLIKQWEINIEGVHCPKILSYQISSKSDDFLRRY